MIKVLGHRGVRRHKKIDENSLPAFEKAMKDGDGIETDAMVSSDGLAFLCHEPRSIHIPHIYSKTTSALRAHLNKASRKLAGKKPLAQLKAALIDKLRLKKGAKLPSLAELFNLASKYPGKTINIELKTDAAVEPVIKEIRAAVAAGKVTVGQIILTSFNHESVAQARRLAPELKCGLLFSRSDLRDRHLLPALKDKKRKYVTLSEERLTSKAAQDAKPDYFVMTPGVVSARGIRHIRKHFPHAKIMLWTTKKPLRDHVLNKKLQNPNIGPHIDTIITDFPDQMVKHLKKKGFRP